MCVFLCVGGVRARLYLFVLDSIRDSVSVYDSHLN